MARFGRNDWLAFGLGALATGGPAAIRLDAITAAAGKTRGSFYHHFEAHEVFVASLLEAWRRRSLTALGAPAGGAAGGGDGWAGATGGADRGLEIAIRHLAHRRPALRNAVEIVDRARIARLRNRQADPESPAAADYALIQYAACIGMLTLSPALNQDRADELGALTADMIAAHWNE